MARVRPATPKRSALAPYQDVLLRLFSNPGVSMRAGCQWLSEHHGVEISESALWQFLDRHGVRPTGQRGRKPDPDPPFLTAFLRLYSQAGTSITDGQHWLREAHGIIVCRTTVAKWLRKHGVRPTGKRGGRARELRGRGA